MAAWLLTPATLARIWWQVRRLEAAYWEGRYQDDRMAMLVERMKPILEYADRYFKVADCRAAEAVVEAEASRSGGRLRPLPQPDEAATRCPWIEGGHGQ